MAVDSPQLIQTLIESFNALAEEVQNLVDRKTILEHKLRFAHESVSAHLLFSFKSTSAYVMIFHSSRSASRHLGERVDNLYHLSDIPLGPPHSKHTL